MEKSFQFVDGANIDDIARKSIRSHVMKGKNARRTVHRQSRLSLTSWLPPGHNAAQRTPQGSRKDEDSTSISMKSMKVSRNLGSLFLTFKFPIELTPDSITVVNQFFTYIIEKMYPVHFGLSLDEAKIQWLGVLLTDE